MSTSDNNFELTKRQEAVLDVFREEERANPLRVREETTLGKQSINDILNRLCDKGHIRKVTRGLYELDDGE
jgi:predicted transcriptional regulator of viral defense system